MATSCFAGLLLAAMAKAPVLVYWPRILFAQRMMAFLTEPIPSLPMPRYLANGLSFVFKSVLFLAFLFFRGSIRANPRWPSTTTANREPLQNGINFRFQHACNCGTSGTECPAISSRTDCAAWRRQDCTLRDYFAPIGAQRGPIRQTVHQSGNSLFAAFKWQCPSIQSASPSPVRAGLMDGNHQARGVRLPISALLIAATALELGHGVATANVRRFAMVPALTVVRL